MLTVECYACHLDTPDEIFEDKRPGLAKMQSVQCTRTQSASWRWGKSQDLKYDQVEMQPIHPLRFYC